MIDFFIYLLKIIKMFYYSKSFFAEKKSFLLQIFFNYDLFLTPRCCLLKCRKANFIQNAFLRIL